MATLQQALAAARVQLKASPSAGLDAQLLLAHVLHKPRSWLYTWPEQALTPEQVATFSDLCARRERGEPIAYLTGKRAFWTFEVQVSPAVLIPRPETELLVELALQLGVDLSGKVADLGTGSGVIAIALAMARADWHVHATELSDAALAIAATNFKAAALPNLYLHAGSWCEPLPGIGYAMIVSNPPYIEAADTHLAEGDVRFEPRSALVAGEQGLADLRNIADEARRYLAEGGWLLLEHGWQQGAEVRNLLGALGYTGITTWRDVGDRERVTAARRRNP